MIDDNYNTIKKLNNASNHFEISDSSVDSKDNRKRLKNDYEISKSNSLLNSPNIENSYAISNNNIISTSLKNIVENCRFKTELASTQMLDTEENLIIESQDNLGSRSSLTSVSLSNQASTKSKKSLKNILTNYHSKLLFFIKSFENSNVSDAILLADFGCAVAKNRNNFLIHGRMFITENTICFFSKMMSFENKVILSIPSITSISKEKTAKVFPNAIRICTENSKYFFTSFSSREKSFLLIQNLMQLHQNKENFTKELKQSIIMDFYGAEIQPYIDEIIQMKYSKSKFSKIFKKTPDNNKIDSSGDAKQSVECELDLIKSSNYQTDSDNSSLKKSINTASSNTTSSSKSCCECQCPNPTSNTYNNNNRNSARRSTAKLNHCETHHHVGKVYLDSEIDMPIDRLFNSLFTNSHFYTNFAASRNTTDMIIEKWPDKPDEHGMKSRKLNYTLALKAKLAPKSCDAEEKQVLHGTSQPGQFYLVDTAVYNSGFPLADSFHCENRYCLIYLGAHRSHLKITSQIVYDKNVFFASKSLIESSARNGMAEYFKDLETHLKAESGKKSVMDINNSNLVDDNSDDNGIVDSGNNNNNSLKANDLISSSYLRKSSNNANNDYQHCNKHHKRSSSDGFISGFFYPERSWLILILLSLLICLCLSFLYSRFRQLEEIANRQIILQQQQANLLNFNSKFSGCDGSKDDSCVAFNSAAVNSADMDQWKVLIDTGIQLVDRMKQVLEAVKTNINKFDKLNVPMSNKSHD